MAAPIKRIADALRRRELLSSTFKLVTELRDMRALQNLRPNEARQFNIEQLENELHARKFEAS